MRNRDALPLSILQRVQSRRARKGKRRAAGTPPNRSERAKYQRELQAIVKGLQDATRNELFSVLKRLEADYTQKTITSDAAINDAYAGEINKVIRSMSNRARRVSEVSENIASEWANGVDSKQRAQFYNSIKRTIGVDLNGIVQEPGLRDTLDSRIATNVSLINSLPDEYYKKISTIVNDMTSNKNPSNSIIKELRKVGIQTQSRAKLIARDQTQKLNATITQTRQEALGIEEYEWSTSGDERVRKTHADNNGKIFRWDSPPAKTGHPGDDIQCRCVPLPIIDLDKIKPQG